MPGTRNCNTGFVARSTSPRNLEAVFQILLTKTQKELLGSEANRPYIPHSVLLSLRIGLLHGAGTWGGYARTVLASGGSSVTSPEDVERQ